MRLRVLSLRPLMAAIGLCLLLAAGGLYLILAAFELPVRVLFATGILLLGVCVALDPDDVWRRATARTTLHSGNTALMVLAFLGILVMLNVLGARYAERWDLTASQQYTLSEMTLSILQQLEQPVSVTGFFFNDDPRRMDAEDLLREYQVRADGRLSVGFVDPELEPARAISLGVRDVGTLVFQQDELRQSVIGVSEQEFTTALLKLTRPDPKTVYFTQGHGERDLDSLDQDGYSQVRTALEQDNYEVQTLSLITEQHVPADAAVVVIAGPSQAFADEEKEALRDYLAGGGKLIVLLDPRVDVNLDDLTSQWQVRIGTDPVIDPASAFLGDSGSPVVQQYEFHPITESLRAASFFPFVAPIEYPSDPIQGVSITPLAETTDRSWVETDPETAQFDEGVDPPGPVAIAVVIEASATDPDPARTGADGAAGTRAVLIGDSDFISNHFLRVPSGNLDLFLNTVSWLAESEEMISIRPREQESRMMFLTGAQLNTIILTSTALLPLMVVLAGVAVWWSRR